MKVEVNKNNMLKRKREKKKEYQQQTIKNLFSIERRHLKLLYNI